MAKLLKGLAAVVLAVAGMGAALFSVAVWMGERKMDRSVDVRVVPVAYARDPSAARQGKALFESRGCAECHGADGGGRVLVDVPGSLQVRTPNVTRGRGSPAAQYNEGDWVRTLRHGVDPRGRALLLMPSDEYNRFSDAELAALVAYVRSLPPVAGEPARLRLPAHVKALYGAGALRDAAEKIDHRRPAPPLDAAAAEDPRRYLASLESVKRLNELDLALVYADLRKAPAPGSGR